jgi:hypothetical protein
VGRWIHHLTRDKGSGRQCNIWYNLL